MFLKSQTQGTIVNCHQIQPLRHHPVALPMLQVAKLICLGHPSPQEQQLAYLPPEKGLVNFITGISNYMCCSINIAVNTILSFQIPAAILDLIE